MRAGTGINAIFETLKFSNFTSTSKKILNGDLVSKK
jgi:hypothetical protein